MKKELVENLLENYYDFANVTVQTNIAQGRGINGVDYKAFISYWRGKDYTIKSNFFCDEECLVVDVVSAEYCSQVGTYYIPYENIGMIFRKAC